MPVTGRVIGVQGQDRFRRRISSVQFNRNWNTAVGHGRTLRRSPGVYANFCDVDSDEYWVSGPKRDRTGSRYSVLQPQVDENVRAAYQAFLAGAALLGRERG